MYTRRTGSKLGISPLMLAAMNGHTSTVKLLLDMGSDINAQVNHSKNNYHPDLIHVSLSHKYVYINFGNLYIFS